MAAFTLTNETTASGYAGAAWSVSPAARHYSYRLYLRPEDETDWTLIYEDFAGTGSGSYDAYQFGVGIDQDMALVEVTQNLDGSFIEGVYTTETFTPGDQGLDYWLIHPSDQTKTMRLGIVKGDSFETEVEHEVVNLLGRGRKINLGETWGVSGQLELHLTPNMGLGSARDQRLAIDRAIGSGEEVYLRTPFGDLWKVWIGGASYSRLAGTGSTEVMSASLDFAEVA